MVSADTQLILNTLNARIDQTISTVLSRIQSSDSLLLPQFGNTANIIISNLNNSLNIVNANLSNRISAIQAQQANIQNAIIQAVNLQIQAGNSQLTGIITNLENRTLQAVQQTSQQGISIQHDLTQQVITAIHQSTEQLVAVQHDTTQQAVDKIIQSEQEIFANSGAGNTDTSIEGEFVNSLIKGIFRVLFDIDIDTHDFHSGILEDALQPFVDSVHDQADKLKTVFENIGTNKYQTTDDVKNAFYAVGVDATLTDLALLVMTIATSFLQLGGVLSKPLFQRLDQLETAKHGLTQLDAGTVIHLYRLKWITYEETHEKLKLLGFSRDNAELIIEGSYDTANLESLRLLFYRGVYNLNQTQSSVDRLPMSLDDKKAFMKSLDQIPGMADLVSMAVKEAFSPETAQAFGQYEDYPEQLTQYAIANGFSREWATRYWAAHWNLPSPQQGFEMFHRGIINNSQLTLLLKALDVMPFWREKLTKMTYTLPTRVDIRRMYGEDIINYNDVYQAYLANGYEPIWAKRLADFAVRYDDEQDAKKVGKIKDLTFSTVETAYKRKIIQRNEAVARLQQLKYIQKDIDLLLALWDYQEYVRTHPDRTAEEYDKLSNITLQAYKRKVISHAESVEYLKASGYTQNQAVSALGVADVEFTVAYKADIVQLVEKQYLNGMLSDLDVQNALTTLGFSIQEVQPIISGLVVRKNLSKERPTLAVLSGMAKKGIISVDDFRNQLKAMNYDDIWIEPMLAYYGLLEE